MRESDEKRLEDLLGAGEPLTAQAIEALRKYHAARGVLPDDQVEGLRKKAEFLFEALSEYQQKALGGKAPPLQ